VLTKWRRVNVYPQGEETNKNSSIWEEAIGGTFSTAKYPPALNIFDPVDIAQLPAAN